MQSSKSVEALLREKKIYQIVNPKIVLGPPDLTVHQAIEIMQENKSGYLVIAQSHKVLGIFTEDDLVQNILEKDIDWNRPVKDFMKQYPFVLNIKESVGKAIDIMGQHRVYHIPLVDDSGDVVNVISVRTLIRFLSEFYPTEIYNLPPKIDQIMASPEGG